MQRPPRRNFTVMARISWINFLFSSLPITQKIIAFSGRNRRPAIPCLLCHITCQPPCRPFNGDHLPTHHARAAPCCLPDAPSDRCGGALLPQTTCAHRIIAAGKRPHSPCFAYCPSFAHLQLILPQTMTILPTHCTTHHSFRRATPATATSDRPTANSAARGRG